MIWAHVTVIIVLVSGMLFLYFTLRHNGRMSTMADQEETRRKLVKPLEEQPQSGFWIQCASHANLPLTQAEYEKQSAKEQYRCPFCGQIPRKIWRKI
jgi:uncharacterized membrane protein